MAQRRIQKELQTISTSPPEGVSASLVGDDLFHWKGQIQGSVGTPYEGGVFEVDINFPYDYPLKPPKVVFTTKIYHPNVGQHGEICIDILKNKWTPAENISKVLVAIYYLLATPDPDDSLSAEIAAQYKTDRNAFNNTAKEWTQQYAKPSA